MRLRSRFKKSLLSGLLVALSCGSLFVVLCGWPPACCFWAVRSAPIAVVKACFRSPRDIYDASGFSPITAAVFAGRPEVVQHLVDVGYDVNSADRMLVRPLTLAVYSMEMTQILLLSGANPNKVAYPSGYTPLMCASARGQMESFELLLHAGADIQFVSPSDGWTALMLAAKNGQLSAVDRLLKAGANRSVVSKAGLDALHYALIAGREDIAKLLANDADELARVKQEVANRFSKPGIVPFGTKPGMVPFGGE